VAALTNSTTGNDNIALGAFAGSNVTTASNVICIGANLNGEDVSNSCYIGQIFGATSSGGAAVLINSDGKLGTATCSRRFKREIKPMKQASEVLFALKPVTFHYRKEIDPAGKSQFGLVAEDVEKVNPDLIVRDKQRKPYTVRYDQVNAMLLNEFLKEHRKVQEQEAIITGLKSTVGKQETTIAQQQRALQAVNARLDQQADQIQKVSEQIQMSNAEWRTVASKE
jgi:predicted ribosome quality control (RQC) complex YloA/Tae2 family protein